MGIFDSFVSTLGKFEPVGIEVHDEYRVEYCVEYHVEVRVDAGADIEAAVDAPSDVDVEDTSKDDDKSFPPPKSSLSGSSIKKDWLLAEKIYYLVEKKRMKGIDKQAIKETIAKIKVRIPNRSVLSPDASGFSAVAPAAPGVGVGGAGTVLM